MKAFPTFIHTTGRRVVIVGGGEQAAQKARLLLNADSDLVVVAATLEDELQGIVDQGRARHVSVLSSEVFANAAMIFIGTGCPGLDAAAHGVAKAAGCLVNVVDQPERRVIGAPVIVDRDPVFVAESNDCTTPVRTREVETRTEGVLPLNLGGLARLAGRLRPTLPRKAPVSKRRAFWAWGLKDAIGACGAPTSPTQGHISLVGAGPGARDLLTLRAVERLQEADVIFYDRLVEEDVLELARRDAKRVFVGKDVGAHTWPQDTINALVVAEAVKGQKVVRLKSGDPGIFGRATEEMEAAQAAGVPVELVPGVTAASAAGAALGRSLTERGVADTFVITTGSGCSDNPLPNCTRMAGPGTTIAFYMSARQAERIAADLSAKGMPENSPVDVCVDVSKDTQRMFRATLSTLDMDMRANNVTNGAIILATWPRAPSFAHDLSESECNVVHL